MKVYEDKAGNQLYIGKYIYAKNKKEKFIELIRKDWKNLNKKYKE